MFSHDSPAFKLACCSLYGRTFINNNEEEREVIGVIKARRDLIKSCEGDYKTACLQSFGFTDPNELMDGDK